jgi:hypothetical protein
LGWWVARHRPDRRFVGRGGLRPVVVGGRDEVEVGYERDVEHAGLPHVLYRLRRAEWTGGSG